MMLRTCLALSILATLLMQVAFAAEPINLSEESRPGDCASYRLELQLSGRMFLNQEGRKEPTALEAKATHYFVERVLTADAGAIRRSVRHYAEAKSRFATGPAVAERGLSAERRLIVAEGATCTSPAGPLTREELDMVASHFPPHVLPGLLPGRPVNVGDHWYVNAAAVQTACLFNALGKYELVGKLAGVQDGRANFTLEGSAEGAESGAPVKLTIRGEGTFDLATHRIVRLVWKQKDERGEGPISPASTVEATITLTREALKATPPELADAVVAGLPQEPATLLRYVDPRGEYRFDYSRDWHITGETDTHLILRLLENNELLAQATVTRWKATERNQRMSVEEFRKRIAEIPGWVEKTLLDESEVPVNAGRRVLRRVSVGEVEGRPVAQGFHLVSGPQGQQVSVTVAMKPDKLRTVAPRDLTLVTAIGFLERK